MSGLNSEVAVGFFFFGGQGGGGRGEGKGNGSGRELIWSGRFGRGRSNECEGVLLGFEVP